MPQERHLDDLERQYQEAAEQVEKIRAHQRRVYEAYQRVFGNPEFPEGQIVLEDLRAQGFVDRTTFTVGADEKADPYRTILHEGARRFWLYIQSRIKVASNPALIDLALAQIKNPLQEDE